MNTFVQKIVSFFRNLPKNALSLVGAGGKRVGSAAGSRQARYGTNSLIGILAVLGILIVVNLMVRNAGWRWDTTKNKVYSLSPESIKVIKNIKEPVKIYSFYSQTIPEDTRKILDEYSVRNPKIEVEYIDAVVRRSVAESYGVTRVGTVIFTQGDRKEETISGTEADFTSALIKLQNKNKVKITFWTGSGEKDFESTAPEGFSELKTSLERLNYTVTKQDSLKDPQVASGTGVLVIAGPQNTYNNQQRDALTNYLNSGGRVLVMLGSTPNDRQYGIEDILARYGVETKRGVVIDTQKYFLSPVNPGVDVYEKHQITENLPRTMYPGSILVKPADKLPDGIEVDSLAKSSTDSWLETAPLNASANPQLNPEQGDVKGPVGFAVAMKYSKVEDKDAKTKARMVVIGNIDQASNFIVQYQSPDQPLYEPGNLDLLVNSVNWLSSQENLINIVPKEPTRPTISLTTQQTNLIRNLIFFVLPVIPLLIGFVVWRMRKGFRIRK